MLKRKLSFFTHLLYGGGVERILQIISSNIDFTRYDVTIYSIIREKPLTDFYSSKLKFKYIYDSIDEGMPFCKKLYVKVKNKVKMLVYDYCSPSLFWKLFINEKPDVAIAFIEGYTTRIVSGFPNCVNKIAWVHTDLSVNHWTEIAFKNLKEEESAYLAMDQIVCVSKCVKQQLDCLFHLSNKSIIIYNPIDNYAIQRLAVVPWNSNSFTKEGAVKIVTIGSLKEVKGHDRLIDVVQRLIIEKHNVTLWIVGKGEKRVELLNQIISHKIEDRVFLLGYHENPYNILKAADIYVCSSYAEGYNTAISEALVLGVPVVSTECSGVKEQLGDNNEWGICVPQSSQGLYEGITKMLDDKVRQFYAKQATQRGMLFHLKEHMAEIEKLIEQ